MSATALTNEKTSAQTRTQGRVLLITDDAAVGTCIPQLRNAGFFVAEATGGANALVALQRTRPHVVIVDTNLKGISAAEMARLLTEAQDTVPVVLIGVEASSIERRAAAMASGAFDYFRLPTELALLLARTSQLVAHKLTIDGLRAEADRDFLTELANNRRFRKALGQEIERWRRYRMPCSLILLDVDHLKRVNDAHGHPAGDQVIRSIGNALKDLSRDNDTAARLGGEEFALLLAGVEIAKAVVVAERLRLAVAAQFVEGVGQVTISLGVAACPSHAQSGRELFAKSDAALYRAKRGGRNRTLTADDGISVDEQQVGDSSVCELT
ncbi:MAG: diguanylate cyclase [Acidobacteria bacterium]|nr:diguanylate cyclase [Acidobacteriota bacterium]